MKRLKNKIVKVVFPDRVVLFGNSYKPWEMQVREFMHRHAKSLSRPVKVMVSNSPWKSWGGLAWCNEEAFQHELNREGRQDDEPDNPNPRQYKDMVFVEASEKDFNEVISSYVAGQKLLKINSLTDGEYKLYRAGKLEITV